MRIILQTRGTLDSDREVFDFSILTQFLRRRSFKELLVNWWVSVQRMQYIDKSLDLKKDSFQIACRNENFDASFQETTRIRRPR